MDIKNKANKRTENFYLYDMTHEVDPYDYEKEGILTKSLPGILFKGNTILVSFLQLMDMRLIMMFKYIDRLKRFKWISWY